MSARETIVVSHGFQSHYELGVVNALADNGVPVTLLGSDMTLRDKLRPAVEFRNIRGSQAPGRPLLTKLINMARYHLRLLVHVARNRHKTVLLVGLVEPAWLVGVFEGLLLRLLARRVVLVVHNLLPHNRHTTFMAAAHWCIYRLPHDLIVHTPVTGESLARRFSIPAARITVMEHGANDAVPLSDDARNAMRVELGFSNDDVVMLFFGMISEYKGLDLLIDAFDALGEGRLLVAGHFANDAYGRAMKARLAVLTGQGRARVIDGYLPESEVGRVFAAADAVVLPYRYIDQSGVLLLALTMGVPLVATDVGGVGRYVTPETGVLVARPEGGEIAAGLRRFLAVHGSFDPVRIRAIGARYAWPHSVAPLVDRLKQ